MDNCVLAQLEFIDLRYSTIRFELPRKKVQEFKRKLQDLLFEMLGDEYVEE